MVRYCKVCRVEIDEYQTKRLCVDCEDKSASFKKLSIREKLNAIRLTKKSMPTFKKLSDMDKSHTIAGMSPLIFVREFVKRTDKVLEKMTDDELEALFTHPDTSKLLKAMPKLKKKYEEEIDKRYNKIS